MQLESLCKNALEVVKTTAAFLGAELGNVSAQQIETKALNSLVSYVDKTAESQLVEGLHKLLPESTFLTEEDTVENQESPLQWIIDPLDGTTNFLHGLPCFSVSVALQQDGQTVIGIVYEVNRQEGFYAWKGGGAFCNGRPVQVTGTTEVADSLVATGFPYYDFSRTPQYLQVLEYFMKHSRGIRRFGSAAVDLAYVSCGRFDAFYEYSLHPWDVAAGAFLVEEAGGQVSDFRGGNDYLYGQEMVASNGHLHGKVLEALELMQG